MTHTLLDETNKDRVSRPNLLEHTNKLHEQKLKNNPKNSSLLKEAVRQFTILFIK